MTYNCLVWLPCLLPVYGIAALKAVRWFAWVKVRLRGESKSSREEVPMTSVPGMDTIPPAVLLCPSDTNWDGGGRSSNAYS